MKKSSYLLLIAGMGFAASMVAVLPALAQGMPNGQGGHFGMRGGGMRPGIVGTVTTVNDTTLTVTARTRPNASTTPVSYTVDVGSNTTIFKNGATSTISSVATGDVVMVQGTVSGTTVTATTIRDGLGSAYGPMHASSTMPFKGNGQMHASSTPAFQGNGEPVIAGSIVSISGSTLTVTNASNVTYTVDASNANIVKGGATSSISSVATGDNVVIQGTVTGSSVVASSVIDQGSSNHGNGPATHVPPSGSFSGFFGAIGNFFKHIFGF